MRNPATPSSPLRLAAALPAFALIVAGAHAPAHAQQWNLDNAGAMRIPTIEELSRPRAPRAYTPPDRDTGPLDPFLNDSTLRPGDVVVTPDGPMRFRGQDGFSHRSEDFSPMEPNAPAGGRSSR